jgi:hypothetical protein
LSLVAGAAKYICCPYGTADHAYESTRSKESINTIIIPPFTCDCNYFPATRMKNILAYPSSPKLASESHPPHNNPALELSASNTAPLIVIAWSRIVVENRAETTGTWLGFGNTSNAFGAPLRTARDGEGV